MGKHRLWQNLGATCAIAGLVAGVASAWTSMEEELSLRTAEYRMLQLQTAFFEYRADHGVWPPFTLGSHESVFAAHRLVSLLVQPEADPDWDGPYLPSAGAVGVEGAQEGTEWYEEFWDPWGEPIRVLVFPRHGAMGPDGGIVLLGAGPDGVVETDAVSAAAGRAWGDDLLTEVSPTLGPPAEAAQSEATKRSIEFERSRTAPSASGTVSSQ